MRVKDVMTPGVIGLGEKATLWEALEALTNHKVSALVVLDEVGAPVGVLSEGDLIRRAELGTAKKRPLLLEFLLGGGRAAEDYRLSHGRLVGEVMTRGAVAIGEDAPLSTAVDEMLAHKVKRLVVVRDGRAVGVLSRSDLLKALMATLPRREGPRSDADIAAAIAAEIDREAWTPRDSIRVTVADGVATLQGAIPDDRLRGALKVLVENTPGVEAVRDRLAWVEPNSGYLVPGPDDE